MYLQRQGSVTRTKSSFISCASPSLQLLSTQTQKLLSQPQRTATKILLLLQGQSSGARGHLLPAVLPLVPGGCSTCRMAHAQPRQPLLLCQLGTVPGGFWPCWLPVNLNLGGWPLATLASVWHSCWPVFCGFTPCTPHWPVHECCRYISQTCYDAHATKSWLWLPLNTVFFHQRMGRRGGGTERGMFPIPGNCSHEN